MREEWEKVKLSYEILIDRKTRLKYDRNSVVADPKAAVGRAVGGAVGNAVATAVQAPGEAEDGRVGGTLYSSFINITDMDFVLVYQLDNTRITRLDLKKVFQEGEKKRIDLN